MESLPDWRSSAAQVRQHPHGSGAPFLSKCCLNLWIVLLPLEGVEVQVLTCCISPHISAKIREAMADLAIVRKPRPDPATPSTNTFPCQKPDGTRSELPMSIGLSKLLKEMEIDALLPIQTATFQAVLDGKDVIGRYCAGPR